MGDAIFDGTGLDHFILDKKGEPPARRLDEWPITKRFLDIDPKKNTRFTTTFYETMTQVNQLHNDMNLYRKSGDYEKAAKHLDKLQLIV